MSKSLAVRNGDLVLGAGRSFEVVAGKEKLFQDLALWVYEEVGLDPNAPGLGTTFEGGFVDGQYIQPIIGQLDSPLVRMEIRAQISDLIKKYMQRQLLKLQQESIQYQGRNTFDPGEVIKKVNSIEVSAPVPTQMWVKVVLTTIANQTVTLQLPLKL